MKDIGLMVNPPPQDSEQSLNLAGRPAPVLRGEGEQGNIMYSMLCQALGNLANVPRSSAVPGDSGQPSLFSPPAVAIHNDGHMIGDGGDLKLGHGITHKGDADEIFLLLYWLNL